MANNIKSTNLPLILTGRGVKPTVPSNIRAVFGDDDFDVTSDLMVGQQAYNVDDDIWYYRNKKGISTLGNDGAIISPNGKVYVPADAEIAKFISMAIDNNVINKANWFNNETEAFEPLDMTGFDTLPYTINAAVNDILQVRYNNDGSISYVILGVDATGTLIDTSAYINSSTADGLDIYAFITGEGVLELSQNRDNATYVITLNPILDPGYNAVLPVTANTHAASFALAKLDEHWFITYEDAGSGIVPICLFKWVDPKNLEPELMINTTEIYTSSDSQPFRLLRTIPGSTEYYDTNVDYPLLPGLYEDGDGFKYIVFNGDPEMHTVNDLINLNANMYNVYGLVDSSTRKILVCTYGEMSDISFFDVDTQEFIEPTSNDEHISLDGYKYSMYNNVHELSDGSFIATVGDYVLTSTDLQSWTIIIGTYLIP